MEDTNRQASEKDGTSYSLDDGKRLLEFLVEKGLDNESLVQRYDEKSEEYNKMQIVRRYMAPTSIADTLSALYPSNRENVRILDAAAGTGLVSVEARKRGFVQIDALDPSEGMLEEARKNNLYQRYICDVIGDNTLDIANDTYTVLTLVSLTSEILKKLSVKCYEELVRVTKSGGYILINHYDYIFDTDVMKANLADLVSRGLWELADRHYVEEPHNGAFQIPDLNSIQHLWDELDRCVRKRHHRPHTLAVLANALQEEWRPSKYLCRALTAARCGVTMY